MKLTKTRFIQFSILFLFGFFIFARSYSAFATYGEVELHEVLGTVIVTLLVMYISLCMFTGAGRSWAVLKASFERKSPYPHTNKNSLA